MQSVGINSDVVVDGRRFHVQTSFQSETGELSASVFEDGRLVERLSRQVPRDLPPEHTQAQVAALHQEASERIRELVALRERLQVLEHAPSHNRLGLVLFHRGFYGEAREQFQRAIALDGKQPEYHKNLGDVHFAQKRYSQAIDCYRVSLQHGPDYADVHRALGRAYAELGRSEQAIAHLRQAIALNGRYGLAHLELAGALLQKLMRHQAGPTPATVAEVADHTRKALRFGGGDSERLIEALQALQHGKWKQALDLLRAACTGRPGNAATIREQELLLRLVTESGREGPETVNRLVAELEALAAAHDGYADLHNSLGVAYLVQGRNLLLRAAAEFRKALRLNPRFRTAKRNLRLVENDGRGFLILLRTLLK